MAIAKISLGFAGGSAGGAAASAAITKTKHTRGFLSKAGIGRSIVTDFKDLIFWFFLVPPGLLQLAPVEIPGSGTMSPQWSRLLIAVEAEELFRRFEAYIATDLRAGPNLRARHCLPEQTDLKLREYDTDAVIVIQPRFQDDLPAAVRRWKSLRPDLQVLFCFRRLPKTRSLVELMRS